MATSTIIPTSSPTSAQSEQGTVRVYDAAALAGIPSSEMLHLLRRSDVKANHHWECVPVAKVKVIIALIEIEEN